MLMALDPQVYMFDEPTAGMSVDEVPVILDLIRALKATRQDRSCWSSTRWTWCASSPTASSCCTTAQLVADGEPAAVIASPVVQQAYLGMRRRRSRHERRTCSSSTACTRTSARITSCTASTSRCREGQVTMLLGRNGAGKTTTLRTIMGLWRRRKAASRFDGQRSQHGDCATPEIAAARHRLRAREHGHLRRPHGEGEHAARRARARDTPSEIDTQRLEWIFGLFPALKKFWLYPAGKLSGGQKQMLAVARAIVEPRALLLIDEPSKGLAPAIIRT